MAENPIPLEALQGMLAQNTHEMYLCCLRIRNAGKPDILLVSDVEDLPRGAETFLAFPFEITLPTSNEEVPKSQIVFDNVDQRIIEAIRTITEPPRVLIEVVTKSSPTTIVAGPVEMYIRNISYNVLTITATLTYRGNYLDEPYPKDLMTPHSRY